MPRGRPKKDPAAAGSEPSTNKTNGNGANLGFEADLSGRRQAARQHGAVRLQARRARPDLPQVHLRRLRGEARGAARGGPAGAEDPDEYLADNVFWVPKEARWSHLQANAKQPTIGKLIDDAMLAIEKAQPVASRACCPRTTPARRSTRSCSAS